MLYFTPFGKTFNPEFIKSPFLETVKIKIITSLVTTSGSIDFDFTEKSQYFIGKHIRNFTHIISGPVNANLTPGPAIYFNVFIHVYSPRAGADNPLGTKFG